MALGWLLDWVGGAEQIHQSGAMALLGRLFSIVATGAPPFVAPRSISGFADCCLVLAANTNLEQSTSVDYDSSRGERRPDWPAVAQNFYAGIFAVGNGFP